MRGNHACLPVAHPWAWFGAAKNDVTREILFDEIELNREAMREET